MAKKGDILPKTITEAQRARMDTFLLALEAGNGNCAAAMRAAGYSRSQLEYDRDTVPAFAQGWADVLQNLTDRAEAELYRRGVEGVEKPVYQGGNLVGAEQEYSDGCLLAYLRARKPHRYNPPSKIAQTDTAGNDVYTGATTEQLRDLMRRVAQAGLLDADSLPGELAEPEEF